jgi:hypothetical protein
MDQGLASRWVRRNASEELMPTYQYVKLQCPKCGSKKVTFVPGRVFVVTSKKS